jgi:hypothetical protein
MRFTPDRQLANTLYVPAWVAVMLLILMEAAVEKKLLGPVQYWLMMLVPEAVNVAFAPEQ